MAWQDACCSVTQLSSHVAHQQNNSWVNIDCLTGCLWSVWVAITPSPIHNRTMSSNTNIFQRRTQVILSSSPFITVYRLYFPRPFYNACPVQSFVFKCHQFFIVFSKSNFGDKPTAGSRNKVHTSRGRIFNSLTVKERTLRHKTNKHSLCCICTFSLRAMIQPLWSQNS